MSHTDGPMTKTREITVNALKKNPRMRRERVEG
jgi:hypothetical protein